MRSNSTSEHDIKPSPETQPSLILGTAGHIDHGKSALVKSLTGTDPDRLAEEKRRGITIELGFAQLVLPSGRHMGVVDVPGHEKFIRHMVAGATGVDVALLVIAADDGIMPQTVEHVAALELLGVRACVVALTKIDLVDEKWRDLVTEDIKEFLAATPFSDAPIVSVSSQTGEGLDTLLETIDDVSAHAERTKEPGAVRMPVDRVFTIRGFGTVATGTLWSGVLSEGDELIVLPEGLITHVRSLQMHGVSMLQAQAGNRVAVSLNNLSTEEVRPGDFLAAPETADLSDRFDAQLVYLDPFSSGKPLKSGSRIHIAHGTREILGRMLLMDGKGHLNPGEQSLAQIRLEEPLPLAYKDRFIVRSYSPMHVIGGGMVLAAHPRRRTNLTPDEHTLLNALSRGDADTIVDSYLELVNVPETVEDIAHSCGIGTDAAAEALSDLVEAGHVVTLGSHPVFYVHPALLQDIIVSAEQALLDYHAENPESTGISKKELQQKIMPRSTPACFDTVFDEAIRRGVLTQEDGIVSHPKAGINAREKVQEISTRLMEALRTAADTPPELPDVAQDLGIDSTLVGKAATKLARDGDIVRIEENRYYDAAVIDRYRSIIIDYLKENGSATAAELKEAMETTRKYAMPVLEYFDSTGLTRREGDQRTLL